MPREQTIDNNIEQGIAAYINYLNEVRLIDLANALKLILANETDKLSELTDRTVTALSNLNWAKMEINNLVNVNRGGETGVHGFISEFAETGIRNARDVFNGLQKSITLLNDNGPADILLQGKEVQMKFYSNILKEINQASNYGNMSMMFPKDHVEVIEKIMSGAKSVEFNGNTLTNSQINSIKRAIEEESSLRGVPYDEWLKSSVNKYSDVQKETIDKTLSREVADIKRDSSQQEHDIKQKAKNEELIAQQKAQPSLGEASKVAGIGAAVQGGVNLGLFIYRRHKSGKDVWEFDFEDWKECGLDTAKGAMKGGISGYAIYGLTNVCHLSAPSAGAITSGTFGLTNAIVKYRKGDIDTDGFIDLVTLNAIDSTGAAIGASIGQAIIPIPVVGALIGSIVTTTVLGIGKGVLNKHEMKIVNMYQQKINSYVSKLDKEYQMQLEKLLNQYHDLGELQQYSFDVDINIQLRFVSSINLAKTVGIPEENILKNEQEIDEFFLSSC